LLISEFFSKVDDLMVFTVILILTNCQYVVH